MSTEATSPDPPASDLGTRRAFVGRVLRRTAYVAPAVLVLQRQSAGAFAGISCKPNGSPCDTGIECCTSCCAPNMNGTLKCMGSMNC